MVKKYLFFFLLFLVGGFPLFGSGIQVLNTEVTTNADKKSAQVKFSLTWDHSWRLEVAANSPSNYDAAWVFIKYRTLPGDNWNHAYISTTAGNHKVPDNALLSLGNSVAVVSGTNTTVGVGAFIYRKEPGNGTIAFTDVELNWDFGKNGLTGGEQVEVCVLATEMVYIPQGAFLLGDYTSDGHFTINRSNLTTNSARADAPFTVSAETVPGNFSNAWIYYNSTSNQTYRQSLQAMLSSHNTVKPVTPDNAGTTSLTNHVIASSNANYFTTAYYTAIPGAYPKGFRAFYCMKYEITQGEYVQFLNKNLVSVKNAGTYHYSGTAAGRYAITKKTGTGTADNPAEYELSSATAAYLPCNYLNTNDIYAWLIWAGLRPMTELEFEKVCRGTEAVPGTASLRPQYAWGSTTINNTSNFSNKGMSNEAPSNATGNCAVATAAGTTTTVGGGTNANIDGPLRAGAFATPVSSREKSGGSYYGVMEMSGNLWERCISIGIQLGRTFAGGHGNGEIGIGTTPDLPISGGWPGVTGAGLGFRGGSYLDQAARARISDRYFINNVGTARSPAVGGRGVRTAL
ncbi:MAG: formylglycine-generating enzyme family protein [Bacteroidales bacterium]|jgi:formylglycine-generating enzyme required for sulfatase activity|nr:formylglycine-generating enzyme family protein [Bacteroidales bacterium]